MLYHSIGSPLETAATQTDRALPRRHIAVKPTRTRDDGAGTLHPGLNGTPDFKTVGAFAERELAAAEGHDDAPSVNAVL